MVERPTIAEGIAQAAEARAAGFRRQVVEQEEMAAWLREHAVTINATYEGEQCRANREGGCEWHGCPQGSPLLRLPRCPLASQPGGER